MTFDLNSPVDRELALEHEKAINRIRREAKKAIEAEDREQREQAIRAAAGQEPRLRAFTMTQLAAHTFQRRRPLLQRNGGTVIREGNIVQVFGPRGTGKTLLKRSLAIVAAAGTECLGFSAPEPVRVLDIDGEMAGEDLQARDRALRFALNVQNTDNLTTVAADWQDDYLPRLDTPEGQALVEPFVADADLIFVDNRSVLFDPEGENDAVAWQAAQEWLLSLRRRRKAVVVIHHSNRQGGARGHSKAEDVLDVIIKLSRPEGFQATDGARFRAEFDKNRGVYGAAVAPFTARLTTNGWVVEAERTKEQTAEDKLRDYLRAAEAADELPASGTAAARGAHVNKAEALKAWAALKGTNELEKTDRGYRLIKANGSAVPAGSGTSLTRQNRFYGSTPLGGEPGTGGEPDDADLRNF
jgi:hypothetical protein